MGIKIKLKNIWKIEMTEEEGRKKTKPLTFAGLTALAQALDSK